MARKIKVPKMDGELSKFEQRFYWLTSTSTGQRLWFLVGVLLAGALVLIGGFLSFGVLFAFLVLYFIVLVSSSYWIGHAQVEYNYWKPYSNTPGHGTTLVGHEDRFSREFSKQFLAFLHGTGALGLPSLVYSGWILQQNNSYNGVFYNEQLNPFLSQMAYNSAFSWGLLLLATWFTAIFVHNDLPGVAEW